MVTPGAGLVRRRARASHDHSGGGENGQLAAKARHEEGLLRSHGSHEGGVSFSLLPSRFNDCFRRGAPLLRLRLLQGHGTSRREGGDGAWIWRVDHGGRVLKERKEKMEWVCHIRAGQRNNRWASRASAWTQTQPKFGLKLVAADKKKRNTHPDRMRPYTSKF